MAYVFRVNGGILNSVLHSGLIRFFKISGDFAWTISDGTVNLLPQYTASGIYTVVPGLELDAAGNPIPYTGSPVPYSAAKYVIDALSEKCEIIGVSLVSGGTAQTDGVVNDYGSTSELHIACMSHNFGWGLAIDPGTGLPWVSAEAEMTAAIQALSPLNPPGVLPPPPAGSVKVFITAGVAIPPATQNSLVPVTSTVSFGGMTVTEVKMVLV